MTRRVLFVALLGLGAALPLAACGGSGPAAPGPAASSGVSNGASSGTSATSPQAAPAASSPGFTVAGDNPVPRNGSQDTRADAAGTRCDPGTLASDQQLGRRITSWFTLAGLPVSASLLRHFLSGAGTPVSFPAGSDISRLASDSAAFATVNGQVQAEVTRQLATGRTRVRLSAGQLPLVPFNAAGGELYWGFRGTQGLSVTGSGHRSGGTFTGTLSYVIRDSYGFPAGDTLAGFGPPMRYLQTACGAPQQAGGARWFPDTITVTVPFSQPG
jgi:hypothetical protein